MRSTSIGAVAIALLHLGCHDSSPITAGPGGGDTLICGNWSSKVQAPALWSKLAPSGSTPTARWLHTQLYDPSSDRMIVFAGLGGSAATNDVWVLENATGTAGTPAWSTVAVSGTAPAPRDEAAAVYDAANDILIVYGGAGSDQKFVDDTWTLTNATGAGGTPQWAKLAPTGTAPSVRFAPSAVYDAASNTMAIFGGIGCDTSSCTQYDEVWLLVNANGKGGPPAWVKATLAGTAPKGRSHHTAVLDATGAMIVFGGETSTKLTLDPAERVSDTWVATDLFSKGGSPAWKQLAPTAPPPRLAWHSAVYDPGANRMIVYGGAGADQYVKSAVWILQHANGNGGAPAWGRLVTGAPEPNARETAAIFSPAKNRMVIFGGNLGDDKLANDAWVLRNANGVPSAPPAKVTVNLATKTVCVGTAEQVVATAVDAAGKPVEGGLVSWQTSDPTICEVDDQGLLEFHRGGVCEVTATIEGVISDPLDVTVATPTTTGGGGGDDGTWIVLRPDGAPATVQVSGGNVTQVTGKAWTILDATGGCSFAVSLSGTIASGSWNLKGDGSGCGGYHTTCTLTGTSSGKTASGPVVCDNDTPGGSIRDTGTWTATKQ